MKLASLADGTPDGRLVIVTRDGCRFREAASATTMQAALDWWSDVQAPLRAEATVLEEDVSQGRPVAIATLMSAMPRSYQFLDASAFLAHNHILAHAWGYARRLPSDPPLMYQGLSDRFLGPTEQVAFASTADEIDFEAEFAVIVDSVPMGVGAEEALTHVRLIVILNDWSLRAFGPAEMKGGFGFLHAKPPSALSPFAVTPDELGARWSGGRVELPLVIKRNGINFGRPNGSEMTYPFGTLIAHAARTRSLCAGTVLGSGAVSNAGASVVGCGCIAERRALEGRDATPYLGNGEQVRLSCALPDGADVFSAIDQAIVAQ